MPTDEAFLDRPWAMRPSVAKFVPTRALPLEMPNRRQAHAGRKIFPLPFWDAGAAET